MTWKYLISVFILGVTSHLTYGQALDQQVSRDFEEDQLDYILWALDDKYDIEIRYNKSLLPEGAFTYSFQDMPMRTVLSILLNDKGLHYKEYKPGRIIVVPAEMVALDSTASVVNTIVDTANLTIGTIELGQTGNPPDGNVTILANVIDARTFGVVPSALVLNLTTGDYLSTGVDGSFKLELPVGAYMIQVNSVAHDSYTTRVNITNSDIWEVIMEPKAYLIDEIVISGANAQRKATETTIGLEQLNNQEIKKLSIFMGEADVVKSLLALAGVTNTGEGSSGFNVRGGSVDQNLITQDGAVIYNPSHVLGFFSIFNPDIVQSTSLNKGHMPAQYGGRVSSVLDINLREANNELFRVKGGIGLMSSKISLDIPIVKSKSGLLLSGRTSYAGWLLTQIDNPDVQNSLAQFNDLNAKYTHNFSENTKVSLSYFQSFDEFNFAQEFGYNWRNRIAQAEIRHLFSDKVSVFARGVIGSLDNSQFQPTGQLAFDLSSGINYNQASTGLLWSPEKHVVRAGVEYLKNKAQQEQLRPRNDSDILPETVDKQQGAEYALYINDRYDLSDRFSLDIGLRYSFYQQLGPYIANVYNDPDIISTEEIIGTNVFENNDVVVSYGGFEPRIAARYNITDDLALKASYNRARQYIQLLSNTVTPTPVDIWQVSTPYIEPLVSDNMSIGVAHSLNDWQYSIDAYYKRQTNTIDYRDFASLLLETDLETQTLSGDGRSYGTELSVEKSGEKMSGRMSYVWSRSERRTSPGQAALINNGDWYAANFDQPHNFKLFLDFKLSKSDRFNVNFVYNTGRPIVAPVGTYLIDGVVVSNFSERNAFRLPAYHRLDLSYTFNLNRRKSARFKSDMTISLYNFYARRNAFSIFYRQATGAVINALQLSVVGSVIPSVSYNFQF